MTGVQTCALPIFLTPALSSLRFVFPRRPSSGLQPPSPAPASEGFEERENYFVGRLPRVVALLQPWANFRSAFSAYELVFACLAWFAVKKFRHLTFNPLPIQAERKI